MELLDYTWLIQTTNSKVTKSYFTKVETRDNFKKRGETEKPNE